MSIRMDQSTALSKLLESVDLVGMVEDLLLSTGGKVTPAAMSGIRLTLRNVREQVLNSHDVMAQEMVQRARTSQAIAPATMTSQGASAPAASAGSSNPLFGNGAHKESPIVQRMASATEGEKRYSRNDLRASLEKVIEG